MTNQITKVPDHVVLCNTWEEQAEAGDADYQVLSAMVQRHVESERLHGVALGHALYLGYEHWDECPVEFGIQHDFDCDTWAVRYSGKNLGDVKQYKRVGELFHEMRTGVIPVPDRVLLVDGYGDIVLEKDEGEEASHPVEIQPDIYAANLPHSKLLIGRKVARSDDGFTDTQWGALFNPDVTVEQFRNLLGEDDRYGWDPDPNQFSAWQDGYCIMVTEGGQTEAVVDTHGVNIESLEAGGPVVLKAWDKICRCLGIENEYTSDF